jgi:hypothetical protein
VYVTGAATIPPLASTTSELPADPLMLMPVTVFVGRVLVVPPDDTDTSAPDEPIAIEPPGGAAAAHVSRNVIEDGLVAAVVVVPLPASVSVVDALMPTAPYVAFVTCTEHVPSAAVEHDAPPGKVAPPASVNVTDAPCAGAPPLVTVAVSVAEEPASTC